MKVTALGIQPFGMKWSVVEYEVLGSCAHVRYSIVTDTRDEAESLFRVLSEKRIIERGRS